jgi:putative flippase GtrA
MQKIFSPSFLKYLAIGVSTVALDFLSLIAFKHLLFLSATVAVALNQLFVWIFNFTLNKHFTFKNKALPYAQFLRYSLLAGLNYIFAVITMHFFSDRLGYDYLVVRGGTIVIMTLWNYFIYKYWIYA